MITYTPAFNSLLSELNTDLRNYLSKRNRTKNDEKHTYIDLQTGEHWKKVIKAPAVYNSEMFYLFFDILDDLSKEGHSVATELKIFTNTLEQQLILRVLHEDFYKWGGIKDDNPRTLKLCTEDSRFHWREEKRNVHLFSYALSKVSEDPKFHYENLGCLPCQDMSIYENGGAVLWDGVHTEIVLPACKDEDNSVELDLLPYHVPVQQTPMGFSKKDLNRLMRDSGWNAYIQEITMVNPER